jgi:predicted Zn-dependent protease
LLADDASVTYFRPAAAELLDLGGFQGQLNEQWETMTTRLWAALAACALVAACAAPGPHSTSSSSAVSAGSQAMSFMEVQQRLEPVAEAECARHNPRANCDFRIVVDDRPGLPPNAYQTLDARGRPILGVTASLVARAQNADELAFVLAHEAAHHIAGHLDQQGRHAAAGAMAYGRAAAQSGATQAAVQRAQLVGAQRAMWSNSKNWELEADQVGARVAARAGFDPVRGAEFLRRLPDPGRHGSTHPSNRERIAVVRMAAGT